MNNSVEQNRDAYDTSDESRNTSEDIGSLVASIPDECGIALNTNTSISICIEAEEISDENEIDKFKLEDGSSNENVMSVCSKNMESETDTGTVGISDISEKVGNCDMDKMSDDSQQVGNDGKDVDCLLDDSNLCSEESNEVKDKILRKEMGRKYDIPQCRPECYSTNESSRKSNLELLSLPCDAMHFIASFLSPSDWKALSCASVGANIACRPIFRRIRLHGFRCVTEVVGAWARGEHMDARELIALYVKSGVPIYPPCVGHTYDTLKWRMSVEAKEMESNSESRESSDSKNEQVKTLDRFYTQRYEAREAGGYFLPSLTYLEEKCLFWGHQLEDSSSSNPNLHGRRSYHPFINVPEDNVQARRHNMLPPQGAQRLNHNTRRQLHLLYSLKGTNFKNKSKIIVKIHRHLANQHFHGYRIVPDDDSTGNISTGSISLSSDFFHDNLFDSTTTKCVSNESMTYSNIAGMPYFIENLSAQDNIHRNNSSEGHIPLSAFQVPSMYSYSSLSSFLPHNDTMMTNFVLQIYSGTSSFESCDNSSLQSRFDFYQRKLETFLDLNDCYGYEECLLDFWDEFFSKTAGIHYYDKHTPVPRMSMLQSFLTKPCPKTIGTVQCEIERFKRSPTGKRQSVKGRLFPTYEYRLFIRDRRSSEYPLENDNQKYTLLMTAKNKGRHFQGAAGQSSKRGVNNYFLYMATSEDNDLHQLTSRKDDTKNTLSDKSPPEQPLVLGRLQSNFIGTEFQIFSPATTNKPNYSSDPTSFSPENEGEADFDFRTHTPSENPQPTNRISLSSNTQLESVPSSLLDSNLSDQQRNTERSLSKPTSTKRRPKTGSWPVSLPSRTNRRGIAPSDDNASNDQSQSTSNFSEENGAITYTANILGNRPRVMDVCIPKLKEDGSECEWRQYCRNSNNNEGSKMLTLFKQLQERLNNTDTNPTDNENAQAPPDYGLLALQNRPPWWNFELGAFVLNFGGRVSVASVKNFQLCDREDQEQVMLQFGRIQGRHSFTMDFQYPLTATQAFAIAISSLQSKISLG